MSKIAVTIEGYTFEVELRLPSPGDPIVSLFIDGEAVSVVLPELEARAENVDYFIVDGRPYEVVIDGDLRWILSRWGLHQIEVQDLEELVGRPPVGNGRIKAPIPGQVTQVLVAVGDEVASGQALIILEAMKMENEIRAPRAGIVKALNVMPGERVVLQQVLAEID